MKKDNYDMPYYYAIYVENCTPKIQIFSYMEERDSWVDSFKLKHYDNPADSYIDIVVDGLASFINSDITIKDNT